MMPHDKKLDSPVWHSLNETHSNFALSYKDVKFYHPDYCPFGGFSSGKNVSSSIAKYAELANDFFIVGAKPSFRDTLTLKNELVCLQMLLRNKIVTDSKDDIRKLTMEDMGSLFRLVNLVQPGYFKEKTFLLGDYYGIFRHGELVAASGERMSMSRFIEVSAVVTHPDNTGRGYARQLVAHTSNNIFDQGKIPYLHVAETNFIAMSLYKRLGFELRRKISFWHFIKT